MSVRDHGLDAIRKSTVEIDSAEYKLRTFNMTGLISESYDYIAVTYPTATQEVYTFKSGGSGGTTVATLTVNYTTSTKDVLLNVART
jgi:hypothetical protein